MTEVRDEDRSMVETVAEAIWDSQSPPGAPPYHHLNNMEKFQVSLIARDCIKAIREPTEAMIEAGFRAEEEATSADGSPVPFIWRAMIDAALEEN